MDPSSCPFCHLEVPSSELEWHANSHFEVEDEDEQRAMDLEFAQQLALAPSSPPSSSSSMNSRAISDLPISRCDAQTSMQEKVSCLIALQTRNTFYEIEHGLMALLRDCLESDVVIQRVLCPVILIIFRSFYQRTLGGVVGGVTSKCLAPTCLCEGTKLKRLYLVVRDLFLIFHLSKDGLRLLGKRDLMNWALIILVIIFMAQKNGLELLNVLPYSVLGLRARIVDFGPKELESFYAFLPGSSLGKEVKRIHNGGKREAIQVCGPMDRYLLARNHDVSQASSSGDEKSGCSSLPLGDSLGSISNENLENKFTRKSKGNQVLIDWIWNYFSNKNVTKSGNCQRGSLSRPLYFQHDGHSRTVVGIQVKHQHNGMQQHNLLILDPGHRTADRERSLKQKVGWQKFIKRGVHTLKKPQYQLCYIGPGIANRKEVELLKTIESVFLEF